jgi:hypothetical protein
MQHEQRASPYNVSILCAGLTYAKGYAEDAVMRVAWVVEDRQGVPVGYGYTDFIDSELEEAEEVAKLRRELSDEDFSELISEVYNVAREEAAKVRDIAAMDLLLSEGIDTYASYN